VGADSSAPGLHDELRVDRHVSHVTWLTQARLPTLRAKERTIDCQNQPGGAGLTFVAFEWSHTAPCHSTPGETWGRAQRRTSAAEDRHSFQLFKFSAGTGIQMPQSSMSSTSTGLG